MFDHNVSATANVGIYVYFGTGVQVQNNDVHDNGLAGIRLYGSGNKAMGNTISTRRVRRFP